MTTGKGDFFSESAMCFSNLQISKKKIYQKAILNLKFKFPPNNSKVLLGGKFKFQVQDTFFGIFFFGDLDI